MISIRTPWLTRVAKGVSLLGSVMVTLPLRIVSSRWFCCLASPLAAARGLPRCGHHVGAVHRPAEGAGRPAAATGPADQHQRRVVPIRSRDRRRCHRVRPRRRAVAGVVAAVDGHRLRGAFAGLMAISRTYLGAHWLTDTIAGVCIGTGLALMWPAALEIARERTGAGARRPTTDGSPTPCRRRFGERVPDIDTPATSSVSSPAPSC